jgi:hypothetical protein
VLAAALVPESGAGEHTRQRALRPKRRGRSRKTVVTGFLIIDDSVHVKRKGRKMEGLGYRYASTERRTVITPAPA